MLKKMKKNEKGFTLVELVVVIAILAVLAMLLVPRIMGNVDDANKSKEIANARTLASEITVHNATAKKPAQWITGNPVVVGNLAAGVAGEADAGKVGIALPDVSIFPDATIVLIRVDAKGNASIDTTP